MKKDFVPVKLHVSRMNIEFHMDALHAFLQKCLVYGIQATANDEAKKDEQVIEENDFGTDIVLQEEAEYTSENATNNINEKQNEKRGLTYWQKWQNTVTRCIIDIRKNGGTVSRITRTTFDKKKEVMLLVLGVSKNCVSEIFSKNKSLSELPFTVRQITDFLSLRNYEIVNLLFGLLPYYYANIPSDQYPYGGYQVYVKSRNSQNSDFPTKASFATVFVDQNHCLQCKLKPYYKYGKWIEKLTETYNWESEANRLYHIASTGDDDFLTRGCDPNGEYTDKFYRAKYLDKLLVRTRLAFGNTENRSKTKQVVIDRAIFRFNKTFGHLMSLMPECWDADKHWSEVTNESEDPDTGISRSGYLKIREDQMEAVNFTRTMIEEGGGFSIIASDYLTKSQNDLFESTREKIESFYRMATYQKKSKTTRKNALKTEWIIPVTQGRPENPYTIADAKADCFLLSKKEPLTISAKREEGQYRLVFPEGTVKVNLTVFIQKSYNVPLLAREPLTIQIVDDLEDGAKISNVMMEYSKGFGVDDGHVWYVRQSDDGLTLCLLPDNITGDFYNKEKKQISIQHFGLIDLKDKKKRDAQEDRAAFPNKCQKTMYELAIRQAFLDGEIPIKGHLEAALYAFYVPSKRNGNKYRTKAHHRYFFYDGGNIREVRFEDLEKYTNYFPRVFEFLSSDEPKKRENIYFVKTASDTYYLWKTDMIALGNTEVDEDGNLKGDSKSGIGKSTDVLVSEVPGGFGVTFYHEKKDHEDIIYYCSAGFLHPKDVQANGWQNASHIYEVHHEKQDIEPDYSDLREMLTDPLVRLNQNTVRPSIFKYLDEAAKCSGRR